MFGTRLNGWDCRKGGDLVDGSYVETDPTGRYGRYGVVLGKGAMKTVYRAFDELQGIEVAWNQARICDVLRSPEALEHLYSEVHLLDSLKHDSIISFHTSWVDPGRRTFNFITEMFTSGTLREYRRKYRRLDIRAVKNWARQILHGLVYLHSHDPPVIHRDLKCDNIFVNGHLGQVKIGDLGLAAVLKGSQQAHSVIGTPEFMAPELYDEEYNELVDIYSFGMCVLEMLTGDYPYSECSNPAQIYKKVTSGKLPNAFHKITDKEAQCFIGRCLKDVSKRPSAWELLHDPFLQLEDMESPLSGGSDRPYALSKCQVSLPASSTGQKKKMRTDMKITGKINPDDDTIYLRVQISDKYGSATNVYFPFDINTDTPIAVANEMVNELEITDRDASSIADVIEQEISALVPHWRDEVPADVCSYQDDGFSNYMSSPTSSHSSYLSRMQSVAAPSEPIYDFLQDPYDDDNDTTSQLSTCSDNYSYANGISACEQDSGLSPQRQAAQSPQYLKSSRFCPEESTSEFALANKLHQQCSIFPEPLSYSGNVEKRCLKKGKHVRNKSLVDVRGQLLHQSLLQELNNRLSKTVGSVENISYQYPVEAPCKGRKVQGAYKSSGRRQS